MRQSVQTLAAKLLRSVFLFTLLFVVSSQLSAQVSGYTWVAGTGTYTQLSGAGITTSTTVTSGNADDGALVITLPFTFYYNKIAYTQVTAGTNGWLAMGSTTSTNAASGDLFTNAAPANAIAGWWGNLNLNTGSNGAFRHGLTATNVYSVQYDQFSGASGGGTSSTLKVRFQINIYGPNSSNPGAIEILYGAPTGSVTTPRSIGIKSVAGTTVSYKNGLNGLSNSTTQASAYPATGTKYTFTPPAVAYQSQFISMNTGSTTWCAGELRDVTVTVKNIGTATWTSTAPGMNIGLKWNEDSDYGAPPNSIPRVSVEAGDVTGPVTPGETITYTFLNVPASLIAGTNNLTFDVVKEGDCWFGNNNNSCGPGNAAFRSPNQTIVARPTAVAGTNINTCSNSAAVNITAGSSATNQSSVTWTSSGTGTFANATSLTTATYTPSAADITAGSVILTLTATPNAPCVGNATSNKTLTINQAPTAVAGTAVVTCSTSGAVNITAGSSATNQASITWTTTNGTGTFANATSLTTATYTPSAADITAGSRTLVLTAVGNAGCANVTSSKAITITGAPTANAGAAQNTCANSGAITIGTGATSTNNSGVTWTSSGTGTFTNATSLNGATYDPSPADITAGSVTLTLTATPNAPCASNAVSNKTLTINQPPTANAGTAILTCSSTGAVNITAGSSATNQASITWTTTNGTGTFANATSLTTATYTPSAADITAGSRTLVLTAVARPGCTNVTSNKTISITAAATAVAGTPIVTCANSGPVSITAGSSATNNGGVTWTSSGTGTFTDANSLTTATYDPSAADILSGSVTLTLTATGNAPCGNAISTKSFTISPIPTSTGVTICQGTPSAALTAAANCGTTPGTAGPEFPATGATSGGGTAWGTPTRVIANDNLYATVSGTGTAFSQTLTASDFGFAVPTNAQIQGITVGIARFRSGGFSGEIQDNSVRLVKAGSVVGANKGATSTNWPSSEALATYGAANDLWSTSWTPAEVNATGFGVALIVDNTSGSFSRTANVDYMQITVTYSVPGVLNWFTASSGGTSIGSGTSFDPVGVLNSGLANTNTPGTTTYYVECSTIQGCRTPTTFVINPAPAAPTSGGDQTVCEDGNPTQTLTATATGGTISWYNAATNGAVVTPEQVGVGQSIFYAQSFDGTCSSITRTPVTLTINAAPVAAATDQVVCTDGTTTQTLTATASGGTITWYDAATNGNVVSTPEQVGVGTVTYYAEVFNGICTSIVRTPVTLTIAPELPAPVSGGDQTVCSNGDPEQTLTATATGGTITWYDAATGGNVVTAPIQTGVGTATYYAEASSGVCTSTSRTAVTVTINQSPLAPVSGGDQTVCATGDPDQTLIATATSPDTITWYDASTGGNIVAAPALIGIGNATFYAEASNGTCISPNRTPVTLRINPVLATPGTISGPLDACPLINNLTPTIYSIAPVAGAASYSWIVPEGVTIVSGQGTTDLGVTFDNNFNLTNSMFVVSAEAPDACTSGSSSIEVQKIVPGIPTVINGPTNACPFIGQATNAVYTIAPVPNATSYTWTVAGAATIVSGQGTTSIEVSYLSGFTSGNVRVTANSNCGNRSPRSLSISKTVPTAPVAINGPTDACPFIGTNTDVVYSIDPVLNATSYTWTVPANVDLISGQGGTSITVRFNAGYVTGAIKVKSNSNCSVSGDRSLTVAVAAPSTPGIITGPTNACSFIGTANLATYSISPVPNATAYIWNVPAGVSISSHPGGTGANDTIITVTYNSNFVAGTSISVQAVACIAGESRTITIQRVGPAAPGIVTGPTNVCAYMVSTTNPSGTPAVYSIRKIANATGYTWTAPSGATISAHPNGAGVNDTIVEVTFSASFVSGPITVAASSDCGAGAVRSMNVTRLTPSTPGAITAVSTAPCPNRQFTYTLPSLPSNSTLIQWTVPTGATIVSGQGTVSIIVSYPSTVVAGNVTATATSNCGVSGTRILKVSLPDCSGPREAGRPSLITSVPAENSLQLSVSPNPSLNDFRIKVTSNADGKLTLRILDLQGRQLRNLTVMPNATTSIGSDLKPGSYFVEVSQGNKRATQKLVKF